MLEIRPAIKQDCALILDYIKALAIAEDFPFAVAVTLQDLQRNLFNDSPTAHALVFYRHKQPCGFAVYYYSFSTTTGKRGLHLDDLYIEPEYQGLGIGRSALGYLAQIAVDQECARFEWWALKSNDSAIKFYQKIGANNLEQLSIFRLEEKAIAELAYSKTY
ncbi:MAG: GCN5-related N-acetyltransferase [Osedax symbiont Rs2]|nr:MAG: GCN5-related N-acetyltransferase [Osedax symbiont Rs2]